MLPQVPLFCSFLCLSNTPVYMSHIFSIHSSVRRHLGCFYVLAIANNATRNIGVHISFQIIDFDRYMLTHGIVRLYGSYLFIFFLLFFVFLWLNLQYMEVPRLGIESELCRLAAAALIQPLA